MIKNNSNKIIAITLFTLFQISVDANAQVKNIQCSLFFNDSYEGAIAFSLDDTKGLFKLWGLKSEGSFVTYDGRGGWLHEIKGKSFPYKKSSREITLVDTKGDYNWQFIIDKQNGAVKIEAKNSVIYSASGKCKLIDNSPKL